MRFAVSAAFGPLSAAHGSPALPGGGITRIGCVRGLDNPRATAALLRAIGRLRRLGREEHEQQGRIEVHILGGPGDIDTTMRHPHARYLVDVAVRAGLSDRVQFWSATRHEEAPVASAPMHILAYPDQVAPAPQASGEERLIMTRLEALLTRGTAHHTRPVRAHRGVRRQVGSRSQA